MELEESSDQESVSHLATWWLHLAIWRITNCTTLKVPFLMWRLNGVSVIRDIIIYESPHDKSNKMIFASTQSDQSFGCLHEETVGPQLPIKRTAKVLIRRADAQADLSFRWVHWPFCWFCHETAQLLLLTAHQQRGQTWPGAYLFDSRGPEIASTLGLLGKPYDCSSSDTLDTSLLSGRCTVMILTRRTVYA